MADRPPSPGLTLTETDLGWIGLAWTPHGLSHLQLPERTRAGTFERLRARAGTGEEGEPPAFVLSVIRSIRRFAAGERIDFAEVSLDISHVGQFRLAIYAAARQIPHGATTTYGDLCAMAGYPGMARETGQAMATNPLPLIIPCHRVLAAGGRLGGFSAPGGTSSKLRLLDLEKSVPPSPPGQTAFAF
ncbi:MAG: methylated-DNA--[protein]-cysteine S-methyltransferase [Rhizobiaceae bacterium]|nr:methylated-DNA--[protein]-cysteine S-methyltransferase [Rhizobiaceae bacterium]